MRYMRPNRESECLKNEGFTLNHQHNRLICWTWGTAYSQQIHVHGTKVTWIDCFMFYQRQIKRRYISSGAMELQNGTTFFWNLSAPGCSVINRAKTAWNQGKDFTEYKYGTSVCTYNQPSPLGFETLPSRLFFAVDAVEQISTLHHFIPELNICSTCKMSCIAVLRFIIRNPQKDAKKWCISLFS